MNVQGRIVGHHAEVSAPHSPQDVFVLGFGRPTGEPEEPAIYPNPVAGPHVVALDGSNSSTASTARLGHVRGVIDWVGQERSAPCPCLRRPWPSG